MKSSGSHADAPASSNCLASTAAAARAAAQSCWDDEKHVQLFSTTDCAFHQQHTSAGDCNRCELHSSYRRKALTHTSAGACVVQRIPAVVSVCCVQLQLDQQLQTVLRQGLQHRHTQRHASCCEGCRILRHRYATRLLVTTDHA